MTRTEHIAWAKQRAHEALASRGVTEAFNSMISDLGKHEQTHPSREELALWMGLFIAGHLNPEGAMARWIDGF